MHRVSASSNHPAREERAQHPLLLRGVLTGAVVLALTTAPAFAFADDEKDDDDSGQLSLNTAVLVNDLGNTGSTGDFAIRGALFSEQLSATVQAHDEATDARLSIDTIDFSEAKSRAADYAPTRSMLFVDYSSQSTLEAARDESITSPVLGAVAAVVAVPVVLVIGALLGRLWARRKRATS